MAANEKIFSSALDRSCDIATVWPCKDARPSQDAKDIAMNAELWIELVVVLLRIFAAGIAG